MCYAILASYVFTLMYTQHVNYFTVNKHENQHICQQH